MEKYLFHREPKTFYQVEGKLGKGYNKMPLIELMF